jgi:hypothetical protein
MFPMPTVVKSLRQRNSQAYLSENDCMLRRMPTMLSDQQMTDDLNVESLLDERAAEQQPAERPQANKSVLDGRDI